MAGVLQQEQLGRYGERLGLGTAVVAISCRLGNTLCVNRQRLAQVKSGAGKQPVGIRNGQRQLADPGLGFIHFQKLGAEAIELVAQRSLGAAKQVENLFTALAIGFTQRAHVALGQRFHQLFDLVFPEVAAQQGNAPALVFRLEHIAANGDQHRQHKKIHGVGFQGIEEN